jgi:hypothetical protein
MAVRHQLIERPPRDVWAVLADPGIYADWVSGTSGSRAADGQWPRVGASLEYSVTFGPLPWSLSGVTTVRREEEPRELELEIDSGSLGTARVAFEIRPWGEDCSIVVVDEHPLRGAGGHLHNAALDVVLQFRHRRMLARLAEVVQEKAHDGPPGEDGGASGDAAGGAPGGGQPGGTQGGTPDGTSGSTSAGTAGGRGGRGAGGRDA